MTVIGGTIHRIAAVVVVLAVAGCAAAPLPAAPSQADPPTREVIIADPATAPPTTVDPGAAPATDPNTTTLGPAGWTVLRLGMSGEDARAIGLFVDGSDPTPGSCRLWHLVEAASIGEVQISARLGVASIAVEGKVLRTPEGMAVGWTAAQVAKAYPGVEPNAASDFLIPVPQNAAAEYRVQVVDGKVAGFALELRDQDCTG